MRVKKIPFNSDSSTNKMGVFDIDTSWLLKLLKL